MNIGIIRAQASRFGSLVLIAPLILGVGVDALGWTATKLTSSSMTATLVYVLAQVFPLCVGICAAVILVGDRLVEVNESMPTDFRMVSTVRLGLISATAIAGSVVMYGPLHLLHVWPQDGGLASVLRPAGAAFFVIVAVFLLSAYSSSISGATITAVATWIFLTFLWDPHITPIYPQRGIPLVFSFVLLFVAWMRLADSERNISKKDAS